MSSTTDRIPDLLADAASDVGNFVSDLGHLVEGVPNVVEDGVSAGLTRGRRVIGYLPFVATPSSNRRWWIVAGLVGVVAAVTAVWLTRRSSDDTTSARDTSGSVRAVA